MRWFRTLPVWAVACVLFIVCATAWTLASLAFKPGAFLPALLVGAVVYAGVMTAFFTVWIRQARVRAGGADALERMRQPFRAGIVPTDADATTWTATVEHRYRQLRRSLWMGPVVFGALLILAAWLAISQNPLWWLGVAFWGAAMVHSVVTTPRALERTQRMRDELRRRAVRADGGPIDQGRDDTNPTMPGTPRPVDA